MYIYLYIYDICMYMYKFIMYKFISFNQPITMKTHFILYCCLQSSLQLLLYLRNRSFPPFFQYISRCTTFSKGLSLNFMVFSLGLKKVNGNNIPSLSDGIGGGR